MKSTCHVHAASQSQIKTQHKTIYIVHSAQGLRFAVGREPVVEVEVNGLIRYTVASSVAHRSNYTLEDSW